MLSSDLDPVAQWIECQPSKLEVVGSSPTGVATFTSHFAFLSIVLSIQISHICTMTKTYRLTSELSQVSRSVTCEPSDLEHYKEQFAETISVPPERVTAKEVQSGKK